MTEIKINKIEKLKRSLKPYDYYKKRLERLNAADLDEANRFYLKNFGIYNHKLRPENFILRVRIAGGRVRTEAFEALFKMAESANSRMIMTSRAQMELHDLSLQTALEYSEEVEKLGLSSWQTYTDNIRNIVTDPLDGLSTECEIEVYETILAMQKIFLKNPDFTGMLPRKFNVAVSGMRADMTPFCGNDLFFALAEKDEEPGFNLYAGGKSSDAAADLNIFCRLEDVPELFEAVVRLYMQKGPRGSRTKTRLFHMLQSMSIEEFREELEESAGRKLEPAGSRIAGRTPSRAKTKLKEGGYAHRYLSRFGEVEPKQAEEILKICERYGVEQLRLGCDQNLYIPHLPETVEFAHSSVRYEGITACAGSKYCVYSLFDTKEESANLKPQRLSQNGITLGYSGCLKGCARHAFSDIGFVGIRTGLYSEKSERGIRLYLGAEYTYGKRAGRLILYAVPLRCIDETVDLLVSLFELSGFETFEEFAAKAINLYSKEALAFWLLLNYYRRYVVKKGAPFMLPVQKPEEEKQRFTEILKEQGVDGEEEVLQKLQTEEQFKFREAIIFLEKAAFAVR